MVFVFEKKSLSLKIASSMPFCQAPNPVFAKLQQAQQFREYSGHVPILSPGALI